MGPPAGVAVAELHGCRGVRAWLDTLDGLDSDLGKFSIEGFIGEGSRSGVQSVRSVQRLSRKREREHSLRKMILVSEKI